MIGDDELELTTKGGQAVTGDAYGTRPYDQKGAMMPGVGEMLHVLMKVTEDFDNLDDLDVSVVNDTNGAGGSEVVLVTKNFLAAALVVSAGVQRVGVISPGLAALRYMTAKLGVNGTDPAAGKIVVWLQPGEVATPHNNGASI